MHPNLCCRILKLTLKTATLVAQIDALEQLKVERSITKKGPIIGLSEILSCTLASWTVGANYMKRWEK